MHAKQSTPNRHSGWVNKQLMIERSQYELKPFLKIDLDPLKASSTTTKLQIGDFLCPKWPSKPRASVCKQDETRCPPSSFNYFCTHEVPFWRVAVTLGLESWLVCSFLVSQGVGGYLPTSPVPRHKLLLSFGPPWLCPKKLATNNTRARPDNTSNLRLARS
jgi:hypothetical protein